MKSRFLKAIAEVTAKNKMRAESVGLKVLLTDLKSDVKDLGFTLGEIEDIIEKDPLLAEKLGFHFDKAEKAVVSAKTAIKALVAAAKDVKKQVDQKH